MFILYSFYETAVTNYHSIGSWKQKKFILLQFLSLEVCNLCQQAHTLSEIMSIILLCHFQLLPVTIILGIPWLPVEWLQSLVLSSHDTLLLLEGHQFYWTRAHPNDLIWTWIIRHWELCYPSLFRFPTLLSHFLISESSGSQPSSMPKIHCSLFHKANC